MLAPTSRCLDEATLVAFASGNLRGEQVSRAEAHIAGCADCQRMLAAAALAHDGSLGTVHASTSGMRPVDTAGAARASANVELPVPGDVVAGKYRIERPLGRGGMGSVMAATHLELGFTVALKILHREGSEFSARFAREGRTLAQLRSEHIVRVFDTGRLEQGSPYIVMEYLEGSDMAEIAARGEQPIPRAVAYVRQVCDALEAAHRRGIVHRDLKPSNLFLTARADGAPVVKVLDFGVSKLGADEHESFTLTDTHTVLGSPRYMSPEQIRASNAVDQRTDIWSLGVILYELLTGRVPFAQRSLAAISVAIATDAPRAPRELRPEIPAELDAIVLRCLAKDPARRFPSAAALGDALAAFDEPLQQPRRSRGGLRGARWWLAAGALSAALLLAWVLAVALRPQAAQVEFRQPEARTTSLSAATDPVGAQEKVSADESPQPTAAEAPAPPPAAAKRPRGASKTPPARARVKPTAESVSQPPLPETRLVGPTDTPD